MNFYDVLAAKNWDGGIPTINFFDLLFAQFVSGEAWETYEGTLPATIISNGDNLRQYQIWGNTGGVGEEVDITGLSEPLCGIGAYTDSLDLSTGILTRRIKKLVLTGEENWFNRSGEPQNVFFIDFPSINVVNNCALCTHYSNQNSGSFTNLEDKHSLIRISTNSTKWFLGIRDSSFPSGFSSVAILKSYLAAQYAAETPVTVWYALAEPEVSTITIPSGLTGTLKGYLIQDGTPTPETPIYPTANGIKQTDDTYSIKYGYKLDMSVSDGTSTTTVPMYISDDPLGKDEYIDYQLQKVYRMINGTLTPTAPPVALPALPTVEGETIVDYAGIKTETTKNILPSAQAQTLTVNGNTCTCDGQGRYHVDMNNHTDTNFVFSIPNFTIPISVGQGGSGTWSMFNTAAQSMQVKLYYNDTEIDYWSINAKNRASDSYASMGGKTINKIIINAWDASVDGDFAFMFTDDGVLPAEFVPHEIAKPTPEKVLLEYAKGGN